MIEAVNYRANASLQQLRQVLVSWIWLAIAGWWLPAVATAQQFWTTPPAVTTEPAALSTGVPGEVWSPMDFFGVHEDYNITVTTDVLILGRTGPNGGVVAVDENGNTLLEASDMDPDARLGPRFSFMMGGRQTGLEFAIWGINGHSYSGVFNQPGVTPNFFGGVPADPELSYDVDFRARLNSVELMFWSPLAPSFRGGLGIRGVGLSEGFDITTSGSNVRDGFFSKTSTDLVGFQIGGGLNLINRKHFLVDILAKTGIYHQGSELNAVSRDQEIHIDDNGETSVTELNIGAEYHFGCHVSLRAGYLGLWLQDVAGAVNQNDDWDIFTGSGSWDYGTVTYQGGYFGIQARW